MKIFKDNENFQIYGYVTNWLPIQLVLNLADDFKTGQPACKKAGPIEP